MPISARTDDLPDSGRSRASGVEMPDISDIEDIVDAMELCEEHEVPYGGLEDIDEFVERLRLHFIKQRCQESRKKQPGGKHKTRLVIGIAKGLNTIERMADLHTVYTSRQMHTIQLQQTGTQEQSKCRSCH